MENINLDFLYLKNTNSSLSKYLKGKKVVLVGPSKYLDTEGLGSWIDSFDVVIRQKNGFPVEKSQEFNLGSRTDLYYSNLKPAQHNFTNSFYLEMSKLKMIIIPYPLEGPRNYHEKGLFKNLQKTIREVSTEIFKYIPDFKVPIKVDDESNYFIMLEKAMGTRPTTGMLTIMDILQYPIKELHLTGFTFRHKLLELQNKYLNGINIDQQELEKELGGIYSNSYKSQIQLKYVWDKTLKNGCHDIKKEFEFFKKILKIDSRIHLDLKMSEIFNFRD